MSNGLMTGEMLIVERIQIYTSIISLENTTRRKGVLLIHAQNHINTLI